MYTPAQPGTQHGAWFLVAVAMTLTLPVGCDRNRAPSSPPKTTADIGYRPLREGTAMSVSTKMSLELTEKPKRRRKKQTRRASKLTERQASAQLVLADASKEARRWRVIVQQGSVEESDTEAIRIPESGTQPVPLDARVTRDGVIVELPRSESDDFDDEESDEETEPVPEPLASIAQGVVASYDPTDQLAKFLNSQPFEQGDITALPDNLLLTPMPPELGLIQATDATISLFRLTLVAGDESAVFDWSANIRTIQSSGKSAVHYEIRQEGKFTVRLLDGMLLAWEGDAKVIPRNAAGEMLPTGSGRWHGELSVDVETISIPAE